MGPIRRIQARLVARSHSRQLRFGSSAPADRDQRDLSDEPLPFRDPRHCLRRPFHRLELRFPNRAESDIVWFGKTRSRKFRVIVSGDAQSQSGAADGGHIRLRQILLTEMDIGAAFLDREAPIIVDDKRTAMGLADGFRAPNVLAQTRLVHVLGPQLEKLDALRHKLFRHVRIIDDEIEAIETGGQRPLRLRRGRPIHQNPPRLAWPSIGVEGAAMSRASIGSAS